MSTFILSALAAGLLSIVVMPWVARIFARAGFKDGVSHRTFGITFSTAIILIVLALVSLIFLELIEILLIRSGIIENSDVLREILGPRRSDFPVILLGLFFGVSAFYWIYLLLNPAEMGDDVTKRAHVIWGYGLIVLLLVGASYHHLPSMLQRLRILPTPWGPLQFAEEIPKSTSVSIEGDIDLERAKMRFDELFLTAFEKLPDAIDRDIQLINFMTNQKVDVGVLRITRRAFEDTLRPVAECIRSAQSEHQSIGLIHDHIEILSSDLRHILRGTPPAQNQTRPAPFLRIRDAAERTLDLIRQQLDDPTKCSKLPDVTTVPGSDFDPRKSPYFDLALSFLLAYIGNVPSALFILDQGNKQANQNPAELSKVIQARRLFYENKLQAWFSSKNPKYLMETYYKTHELLRYIVDELKAHPDSGANSIGRDCPKNSRAYMFRFMRFQLLQNMNNMAYDMASLDWPPAGERKARELMAEVLAANLDSEFGCRTADEEEFFPHWQRQYLTAARLDTAAFVNFMYAVRGQTRDSRSVEEVRSAVIASLKLYTEALAHVESAIALRGAKEMTYRDYLDEGIRGDDLEAQKEIILRHSKRARDYLREN